MDEEEVPVDTGGLGGINFGRLRTDPAAVFGDVYKQQMAAQRAEEASAKERYEAARARIEARNQGPSTSEQLFAISQALLAPRKYRGIAGTIGKISGAFGDISSAQRKAQMSREEQLAQLEDAYAGTTAGFGTQRAKMAGDIVQAAGQFMKPVRGVPVGDRLVDPYSNEPIGEEWNNFFNSPEAEQKAYASLEADPTEANLQALVDYYPRYKAKLVAAFKRGLARSGKGI
jgi:hypothetical protein